MDNPVEELRMIAGNLDEQDPNRFKLLGIAITLEDLQGRAGIDARIIADLKRVYWEMREVMKEQAGETPCISGNKEVGSTE